MDRNAVRDIEQEIGYTFKNKSLLEQAFTRKSYTDEKRGGNNNEILEFYGDRVLDLVVVKELAEFYGSLDATGYTCAYSESESTVIKKRLVNSKSLASRMDDLGFAKHLIMSKSDIMNGAQEQTHVKEDLFEAIIGAVALDCGWDLGILQDTVELMLHLDQYFMNGTEEYEDFVSLVQQWCQKKRGTLPSYVFRTMEEERDFRRNVGYPSFWDFSGRVHTIDSGNGRDDADFVCHLYLEGMDFTGYGPTKSDARMDAAGAAYAYLDQKGLLITMADETGAPSPEKAVSQLQVLAQKGYFPIPEYTFAESHDTGGNPVWECVCSVPGYVSCCRQSSSKKDAKREAAYGMLCSILDQDKIRRG